MAWTCNATLKTLVLLYLSHHAFASSDLLKTCGAKSAASITAGAAKCAASVLNAVNNCPAACHALRAAVANSSEPTYCQKATVSLPAFKAATRSNYIRLCSPKWAPEDVGFAFAGSAFSILYYFGVAQGLIDAKLLRPDVTRMGGLSGGGQTAMLMCAGVSPLTLWASYSAVFAADCLANFNASAQLFPCQGQLWTASEMLASYLPNDTYAKCAGQVRVAVTEIDPNDATMNTNHPWIIEETTSSEDLALLMGATSFLNCQSACKPYTTFRGKPVMDGGYSSTFADLCPSGVKRCVKVESFYPGKYRVPGNDTNCSINDPAKKLPAGPPSTCTLPVPQDMPFQAVGVLPTQCPAGTGYFQPIGPADIGPGYFKQNPLKLTCEQWQALAYFPDTNQMEPMFQYGRNDAYIWAQQERLAP